MPPEDEPAGPGLREFRLPRPFPDQGAGSAGGRHGLDRQQRRSQPGRHGKQRGGVGAQAGGRAARPPGVRPARLPLLDGPERGPGGFPDPDRRRQGLRRERRQHEGPDRRPLDIGFVSLSVRSRATEQGPGPVSECPTAKRKYQEIPMSATRRQFLTNVSLGAGSLVLAPILRQLEAHAAGEPQTAQRFLFVVEGNGLPWQQIQPLGIERGGIQVKSGEVSIVQRPEARDKLVVKPLDGHALPKALEPLSPWKDRVTVVQGLSGRVTGGGHSSDYGALGCYFAHGGNGNSSTPQGETIDAALGKKRGGVFPLIGL